MYTIAADVGGSHISSALFEHSDKVLISESMVTKKVNRKASKEEILSGWSDALALTAKGSSEKINGIGLAVPGHFDYYNGISLIKGVDKFEALYRVNVREELAKKTGVAPEQIRFINDASAFIIGETLAGEAAKFDRCVGITLGTGFGASFCDNGMPVVERDDIPAGGFLFDKLFDGKTADDVFSTRGIIQRHFDRTGSHSDSVLQIAIEAETNPHARETFSVFGSQLGIFLRPYLQTFDAKVLVLGGNICRAYHLFSAALHKQLSGYHIYVSAYGEKAAMIGAARLLDDQYYDRIQETLKKM